MPSNAAAGPARHQPSLEDSMAVSLNKGAQTLFRQFPGRSCLLVAHEGRLLYERYLHGTGPEDLLETDSASKTISALLVGILVTQGKIDVDKPLAEYNVTPHAKWGEDNKFWPQVTSRHLLTHTSGQGSSPPGTVFIYDSGEYIQHLSRLIEVVTSPPNGRWLTPVDWAEETFAEPLGLGGLFRSDGLHGQISVGGNQHLSCRGFARVAQLILNRGVWPAKLDQDWPGNGLPWNSTDSPMVQLISESFIEQMTRPSFPKVVSTYGFLLWLNRKPRLGDSNCCMCTCGVCLFPGGPPFFGFNEEVWTAIGYLGRFMFVYPQRNALLISMGSDLIGSVACSTAFSWSVVTYDDCFGGLLHFSLLNNTIPISLPMSNDTDSTTTSTDPSDGNEPAVGPPPTTTHSPAAFFLEADGSWTKAANKIGWSHPNLTINEGFQVSGVRPPAPAAGVAELAVPGPRRFRYYGGSCKCHCPIGENFGFCYNLPQWKQFVHKSDGNEVCAMLLPHYRSMVDQGASSSCPDIGILQPCATTSEYIPGGNTEGLCNKSFWLEDFGVKCDSEATCGRGHSSSRLEGPTGRMETCRCHVRNWVKCLYEPHPCTWSDTHYVYGNQTLIEGLVTERSRPPSTWPLTLTATVCALLTVLALVARLLRRWRTRARSACESYRLLQESAASAS